MIKVQEPASVRSDAAPVRPGQSVACHELDDGLDLDARQPHDRPGTHPRAGSGARRHLPRQHVSGHECAAESRVLPDTRRIAVRLAAGAAADATHPRGRPGAGRHAGARLLRRGAGAWRDRDGRHHGGRAADPARVLAGRQRPAFRRRSASRRPGAAAPVRTTDPALRGRRHRRCCHERLWPLRPGRRRTHDRERRDHGDPGWRWPWSTEPGARCRTSPPPRS